MTDDERYRACMEGPMECLAGKLEELGYKGHKKLDEELVVVATSKLAMLHAMLIAAGINREMLNAVMAE